MVLGQKLPFYAVRAVLDTRFGHDEPLFYHDQSWPKQGAGQLRTTMLRNDNNAVEQLGPSIDASSVILLSSEMLEQLFSLLRWPKQWSLHRATRAEKKMLMTYHIERLEQ